MCTTFFCPFTLANCLILYSQKKYKYFFFLINTLINKFFWIRPVFYVHSPHYRDHLLETVFHDKTYILIMSAIPYKTEAVVNAMMTASGIQPVKMHRTHIENKDWTAWNDIWFDYLNIAKIFGKFSFYFFTFFLHSISFTILT